MGLRLIDIINIVIVVQCAVFSLFLFQKSKGNLSNFFLALFFLSQSFSIMDTLCFRLVELMLNQFPWLFYIGRPFCYVWGPLIYLYILSRTTIPFKPRVIHWAHFIPFFVFVIYLTISFHIYDNETKRELISNDIVLPKIASYLTSLFIYLQITTYLFFCYRAIKQYNQNIKQQIYPVNNHNYRWLKFFMISYCIAFFPSFVLFIFLIIGNYSNELLFSAIFLIFFILFNIYFYQAWVKPQAFADLTAKPRYASAALSVKESQVLLSRIVRFMNENKPYLVPEITINELADQISIPVRQLSQIINGNLKQNFYDFINYYRVEEAKKILSDKNASDKSVKEIFYEIGFVSKTSFYEAFKKNTGVTPVQYRNKTLNRE